MDWERYITAGTALGTTLVFAGGVVVQAYLHPLNPEKKHNHPVGIYSKVASLNPNLNIVGSGTNTNITPGTGTLFFGR